MTWPNTPHGPWYVRARHLFHVTRTNIAGCTTVCGVELKRGQELTTKRPPAYELCASCGGEPRDPRR